jgi:Protein kinase domain
MSSGIYRCSDGTVGTVKVGYTAGEWTCQERLGRGGNGEVWRCQRPGYEDAAVKFLNRKGRERLQRFLTEIQFLFTQTTNQGVLGILDSRFDPKNPPLWYAMPIATPMRKALGEDPTLEATVAAFEMLSATLSTLAEQGTAHRDLKPENLFQLDDRYVVGDFGLVRYPEAEPLTAVGKRLGPTDFMAPEMRSQTDDVDAFAADVFALAKSLWSVLLNSLPLPGPHRPDDSSYALADRLVNPRAPAIDSLLRRATLIEPSHRVTMREFHSELAAFEADLRRDAMPLDLEARAGRLRLLAEPHSLRARGEHEVEEEYMQARLAPLAVLDEIQVELYKKLENWMGWQNLDASAFAFQLMDPQHWGTFRQDGKVYGFWTSPAAAPRERVTIAASVAVRLNADRETLVVAGGINVESRFAVPANWHAKFVRAVPLGSTLQDVVVHDLRIALIAGIGPAMDEAEQFLLSDREA